MVSRTPANGHLRNSAGLFWRVRHVKGYKPRVPHAPDQVAARRPLAQWNVMQKW
jgi:hypothetical protein